MRTYLKVKIKSLAAEARIIKAEEAKFRFSLKGEASSMAREVFWGLRHHRLFDVRTECRHAHLAYGYIKRRQYKQLEAKCEIAPNAQRIAELVQKYGRV